VEPRRPRETEICEEGETLWLGEDRVHVTASVVEEVDRTQNSQAYHGPPRASVKVDLHR
jgi:hypothetical protein